MPADTSVLVVASDAATRALLVSQVNRLGYPTGQAESVESALEVLAAARQMLILTTFGAGDKAGIDIFRALRDGAPAAGLIVVGGRSLPGALAVLRAGADDYVPQPLRDAELTQALERVARKRAPAALADRAHMAPDYVAREASMAALSRLAANLAHEINNPLTPIIGMAELLLEDLPAAHSGREYAHTIIGAAQRIRDVIRSLLDFARPTAQQYNRLELLALLQGTLLLVRQRLLDQQITVDMRLPEPPLIIVGSAAQLKEALLLLIANAQEAMPEGGVLAVDIAARPDDAAPHVILTLRDSGVGISAGSLPYIFEPFYSTKPQAVGGGMGLTVANSIVRAHGGAITIESVVGEGSTVRIALPLSPAP
jgi:two-component system NtrC family sensor kinase